MRIAFYAPFKPLGHPRPSGDLTIATGLTDFLRRQHTVTVASKLRTRWVFARPRLWPGLLSEKMLTPRRVRRAGGCEVWLSYHTYYKAPDVIGPDAAKALGVPYAVFQGIYSTKRRRNWRTWPGFALNRRALLRAEVVFSNKREDYENLLRLLPEQRVVYVPPGIFPQQFEHDAQARRELRQQWAVGDAPLVLSAAMFRQDVKTRGLVYLLRALARLAAQGQDFRLVLAGDGPARPRLEELAGRLLPDRVRFLGLVPRQNLYRVYSAADVFAFPGFRESLGMVYLEAQSCGLPVVAFNDWGIPEVVDNGKTGLLTPAPPLNGEDKADEAGQLAMARAMGQLCADATLRQAMGRAAAKHVRAKHDLNINYAQVQAVLERIARQGRTQP